MNESVGGMNAGCDEFTKAALTEKLANWEDICARARTVVSPLSGWRRRYDWTLNAVSAAEKRPAYQNERGSESEIELEVEHIRR